MENNRRKIVRNNNGFTLIEVLVVIAILGIVIVLMSNISFFGTKEYKSESTKISNQTSLRIVSKSIISDIRKENSIAIPKQDVLIVGKGQNQIRYELSNTSLNRNGVEIASNISEMTLTGIYNNNNMEIVGLKITLKTTQNTKGKNESFSTTVYLR